MQSTSFALIDCNNFFASCEQVFNPKLVKKPLVILSNNDGCVIARSAEAKALGIKMGAPAFENREIFAKHGVHVLSSNFTLYGDMSHRVMSILEDFGFPTEIYSIDEAFVHLPEPSEELGYEIKKRVKEWTGLPIAIGMGPTKTLAKAANQHAKKNKGVFVLSTPEEIERYLATFKVEDVWGIGRRLTERLHEYGIRTALELTQKSDAWIRKELSVVGLRTVWELRGNPCFEEEEFPELAKSITSSRSFGKKVFELSEVKEAVATFMAKAAVKLRAQDALAQRVTVFVYNDHLHGNAATFKLPAATAYTPELINCALMLTERLFRKGSPYKKAGITLDEIIPSSELQLDIFNNVNLQKREAAMQMIDEINSRFERKTLRFAAEGFEQTWRTRSARRTPRYTTCWNEIPIVI